MKIQKIKDKQSLSGLIKHQYQKKLNKYDNLASYERIPRHGYTISQLLNYGVNKSVMSKQNFIDTITYDDLVQARGNL